uniref:MORN repeat-containing protein n=1 Tax=Guillardia theta TaxID=55529 RepID=A0A7S4PE09_GUITH|mmetsp:Transcript_48772/g.153081  ORF Transcript_48772/g.153081 Transcript_48772/m.153081 type:complete len:220 (+) Transcript_48772:657-1316(+)
MLSQFYVLPTNGNADLMFQKDDLGNILYRYDGEYLQDKDGTKYHHGHATVRFRNGIQFVGRFHMGHPEGKATISFPSSSTYEGVVVQGSAHGEGKFVWSAPADWPPDKKFRKEYSGWFDRGSLTSKGKKSLYVLNKDIYQGEFEDGRAHGKGTFLWEDGRYFIGEFVNGKVHGEGKLVAAPAGECSLPPILTRSLLRCIPTGRSSKVGSSLAQHTGTSR